MISSRDHKRAFDGDQGRTPVAWARLFPELCTDAEWDVMTKTIFSPPLMPCGAEGRLFRGVIYYGLMLTPKGPYVIEYNARFRRPGGTGCFTALETDLMTIIDAVLDGNLTGSTFNGRMPVPVAWSWLPADTPLHTNRISDLWSGHSAGGLLGISCRNQNRRRSVCDRRRPCAWRGLAGQDPSGCNSAGLSGLPALILNMRTIGVILGEQRGNRAFWRYFRPVA